jgi:hypothetical protein
MEQALGFALACCAATIAVLNLAMHQHLRSERYEWEGSVASI